MNAVIERARQSARRAMLQALMDVAIGVLSLIVLWLILSKWASK